MELDADEEGMRRNLHDLDEPCLGVLSGGMHACSLHPGEVLGVEFITVAVTLGDAVFAVDLMDEGAGLEVACVCAEPHGTALYGCALLVFHQVDNRVGRGRVFLRRGGVGKSEHVAGELHDGHLQAETDSEERNIVLPCIAHCGDLSFETPDSESGGYEDAVHILEQFGNCLRDKLFAGDAMDTYLALVCRAGMDEGFLYALVGVLQLDILSDEGDVHLLLRVVDLVEEAAEGAEVWLGKAVQAQMGENHVVEMFLLHVEGNYVDAGSIDALDHVAGLHVAEESDLLSHVFGKVHFRTAADDVRMHSCLLKSLYRMLRRLGFQLLGCPEVWHEGKVDADEILVGKLPLELADCLEERLRLHVADGSSDFRYDDIIFSSLAEKEHPPLYLVSDVGHNLYSLAEECAFALLGQDGVVDSSGGDVVGLAHVDSEETLVVSKVKVSLCAVVGDIAFSVLVGVERAGIHIQVRIELLDCYSETSGLKKFGKRCRDDAFSE